MLTSPPQVLSFHAAAKAQGEVFDVTCFGGCAQYHALRTQGKVGPGMLSSIHIRATDFEAQAHTQDGGQHATSTHKMHMPCMAYLATTHLAWQRDPNHERISLDSACYLQSTRADVHGVITHPIDPTCDMVCIIMDVTTDALHVHLCKQGGSAGPAAAAEQAEEIRSHITAMDDEGDLTQASLLQDPQAATMLAQQLIQRSYKDAVSHTNIAADLAAFTTRCVDAGKVVHVFLCGCNTINLALPLVAASPQHARSKVWLACTAKVWPSDLASWLWHLYGALADENMTAFRSETRQLLDEYTHHWKRQRVRDPSMSAAMDGVASLADLVYFDRLDRVSASATGALTEMAPL